MKHFSTFRFIAVAAAAVSAPLLGHAGTMQNKQAAQTNAMAPRTAPGREGAAGTGSEAPGADAEGQQVTGSFTRTRRCTSSKPGRALTIKDGQRRRVGAIWTAA